MFREQPISGFFLRNDVVAQACYSVVAFFIVLSSAVIELRNTDVMENSKNEMKNKWIESE
jgi:hypothetical protein